MRHSALRLPISLKLGLGFLFALALPTIIVTTIFLTATRDVDRRNIESYIQQNGQRQRQILVNIFTRAQETLREFAEDTNTNRQLVGLLLDEVNATPALPTTSAEDAADLMSAVLLDPATTVFKDVRLLNRDGIVVATAGDPLGTSITLGQDETNSNAFRRITNARSTDTDIDQVMVVSRSGTAQVELVNTVTLRESNNVIGYLVAVIDIDEIIIPSLTFIEDSFEAYSFLLSNNGVIVAPLEYAEVAERSRNSTAVDRAFQNQTGFDLYRIENGTGEEVGGYFTPIQDTPFILITQVSVASVFSQTQNYFGSGGFTLIIGGLALTLIVFVFGYSINLTDPISRLQKAMQQVMIGNFDEPVTDLNRIDEFGDLARTFFDMRQQTANLIESLENRITSRTRDVETTQEISRFAVTQRNLQQLMDDVVTLIVARFPNIYHAQIFLIDSDRRFAVLRASTGSAGQELLSRGHRLAVGSISVIGQVTAQGETLVARNTATSEVHRRNEFLPDTLAELAIPLRIGDEIIGALDVQSKEDNSFDQDQIKVLQTMADQLAIAIENARLYQESIQRLRRIEDQSRSDTAKVWRNYMFDNRQQQIIRQAGTPTDMDMDSLREKVMRTGEPIVGELTERNTIPTAIPVRLRGEVIGVIGIELPAQEYDGNKLQLARDLADRLAISLDNTRLFEQSQRATERERLVNEISAKLTIQTDVNEILQTAVREVGQALRAPQVSIRLSRRTDGDSNPDSSSQ